MTSVEPVKIPEGYKQTEVGVIPKDWGVTALSSQLKESPKYGINAAAVALTGNLPVYLRITDISEEGYFKPSTKVGVDNSFSSLYKLEAGDLVVARTGASVGKSYLYRPEDGELIYAGFLIKLSPDQNKLKSDFFFQYLRSESYWAWVVVMSMRSGQPGINGVEYGQLPIPLPSPKEQTAIANALSDVDSLIASLETLIAKKSAIKTAAMQQLLTGKKRLPGFENKGVKESEKQGTKASENKAVTESEQESENQGSDQLAGSGSINQAAQTNASNISASLTKSTGQTSPRPGYKQTELGEIPEDWEVVELGDIAEFYKGKGLPKSELTDSGSYKCIHYGELFTHYSEKITEIKSLTDTIANTFLSKSNDILMPTSDVTPNGLATASGLKEDDVILGGDVLVIRPKQGKLDSTYFAYIISISKNQIMQLISGSTVYHLYGSDMATFKYAGPQNLEEQTAIANVLSGMDSELDALQQRLNKTKTIKQGMMQELLTGKTRLIDKERI